MSTYYDRNGELDFYRMWAEAQKKLNEMTLLIQTANDMLYWNGLVDRYNEQLSRRQK